MWVRLASSIGGILIGVSIACAQQGSVVINEFMAINDSTRTDSDGRFDDWVEFYNASNQAVDLGGFFLTDKLENPIKWMIPTNQGSQTVIEAGQFLLFWFDDEPEQGARHIGFKLAGEGEQIGLYAPDGFTSIDTLTFTRQRVDVSMGRAPDGGSMWNFYSEPTPGAPNGLAGFSGIMPDLVFSEKPGFYAGGVSVSIPTDDEQAQVHYTLDGRSPTVDSPSYSGPIPISESSVLRVRSFQDGYLPSRVITNTYVINQSFSIPFISLATDPENLYDDEIGILVEGVAAQADPNCEKCQNWWQDWERPVHVEYFDQLGEPQFSLDMGAKVFGNSTRNFPKKSLTLFARGRYGASEIDYELFPTKPQLEHFDGFQLRAGPRLRSVNEVAERQIRTAGNRMDVQATRHVIVFLNGSFHGMFNLLERKDVGYFRNNYGTENIDLFDTIDGRVEGDRFHLQQTLDFFNSPAYLGEDGFEQADRLVDMASLIEHYVFNIMQARADFGNIRLWRERTPEGRWRILMYDLDNSTPNHPSLGFILGLEFPDRLFSMLGRLLKNETFRQQFLNRTADYLNSVYEPDYHEYLIRDIARGVEKEIFPDLAKWVEQYNAGPAKWYEGIEKRVDFAKARPDFLYQHYKEQLGVDHSTLSFTIEGRGSIRVNSVQIDRFPWSGRYFKGVPIRVEAVPAAGFTFAGWSGNSGAENALFDLVLTDSLSITAHFTTNRPRPNIVLNEINYHSSATLDPEDWVELVNPTSEPVDVSGWMFGDENMDQVFVIPTSVQLGSGAYLVLCKDPVRFNAVYGSEADCIGSWEFGLSNSGDYIQLLDADGILIDSLRYDDKGAWSTEPDGFGATLELIHPNVDNSNPSNWTYSAESGGSPGKGNSLRLGVSIEIPDPNPEYSLGLLPNYPNPFHDQTHIAFELDRTAHVEINVFNTLGQLVARPWDGVKSAGRHVTQWRPGSLPSGVYFYRVLFEGEHIETRPMVYLK